MRSPFVAPLLTALFASTLPVMSAVQAQATVEASVATSVVDRLPQGAATQFPAEVGELYVWMRITGAEGTTVQHVWMHDGMEYPVSLDIGGSPWRSWSSKVIPPEWAGDWTVEIRAADGTVLQTLSFRVG